MPNFSLKQQPQYPIKVIDTGSPVSAEQLYAALDGTNAVTLCVRTASGHEKRGGHFFCIRKKEDSELLLETMEGEQVDHFTPMRMVRFINHTAGLLFDAEMLVYCQRRVNFRTD